MGNKVCFCYLSLLSHTSPTEAQVARKQSPKPGGGISTKGKHEHTHTPPGVNRDMCVYIWPFI